MAGEQFPNPIHLGPGASPGGVHSEGHRENRARFADIFKNGFHWQKKRLPTPGTGNYAFETLALYETTPSGPSVGARKFFKSLQPPQLYVRGQMLPTTGIGGVIPGQWILAPLADPYNNTYGGVPLS